MGIVTELETIVCRLPRRREWTTGVQAGGNADRVLVRLRTDDALEGWGEATPIPSWGGLRGRYYGETCGSIVHVIHDVLGPGVLDCEPLDLAAILMGFARRIRGHFYAKSAVEIALQDLRGQYCRQPIYRLLGGAVRPRAWIAHMLSLMPDEEALAEARSAVEADGVSAFQVKGGADPRRDARLISLLRERLPEGTFLRVDANQGYGDDPKRVASIARRLEAAGADAIEQPASSVEAMAAASRSAGIAVIADEACWQADDVLELHRRHAADGASVYVMKAGGIAAAHDVARTAALCGWPCDLNGSLETGIGTAASIHVALASANVTLPSVIPVPSRRGSHLTEFAGRYWENDVVGEGFRYESGGLTVTGRSGLGIAVDVGAVEALAVDRRVSRR